MQRRQSRWRWQRPPSSRLPVATQTTATNRCGAVWNRKHAVAAARRWLATDALGRDAAGWVNRPAPAPPRSGSMALAPEANVHTTSTEAVRPALQSSSRPTLHACVSSCPTPLAVTVSSGTSERATGSQSAAGRRSATAHVWDPTTPPHKKRLVCIVHHARPPCQNWAHGRETLRQWALQGCPRVTGESFRRGRLGAHNQHPQPEA